MVTSNKHTDLDDSRVVCMPSIDAGHVKPLSGDETNTHRHDERVMNVGESRMKRVDGREEPRGRMCRVAAMTRRTTCNLYTTRGIGQAAWGIASAATEQSQIHSAFGSELTARRRPPASGSHVLTIGAVPIL